MYRLSTVLIAAGSVALVASSAPPPTPEAENIDTAALDRHYDCPNHDVAIKDLLHGVKVEHPTQVVTVGPDKTYQPEWHDCQRFIEGASTPATYEQLVVVFASHVTPPAAKDPDVTRTVAVLYNYDETYSSLGIATGWNCLYIEYKGSVAITAWMVDAGGPNAVGYDKDCNNPLPVDNRTELFVNPTSLPPPFSDSDYPVAARWDYDGKANKYYIGMKCMLNSWCRIHGHDVLTASQSYTLPATASVKAQRAVRIKGWYDQQVLAVMQAGTGKVAPSGITAVAFPAEDLDDITDIAVFENKWRRVGTIYLDASSKVYADKLGLAKTPHMNPRRPGNNLSLCHAVAGGKCPGDDLPDPVSTCQTSWDGWWARIEPAPPNKKKVKTKYRCVTRKPHAKYEPPGAVRWLWKNDDELLWFRCGLGCCSVE